MVLVNIDIDPSTKTVRINHFSSGSQGERYGSAKLPRVFLKSPESRRKVIMTINSIMNIIEPPAGGGGAGLALML
jgi:hypothetical protein